MSKNGKITCSEICSKLNKILETEKYNDIDASVNGLQIGQRDICVEKVAFAVDAAEATINEAVNRKADLLITHHGISWGDLKRVTSRNYQRISPLIKSDTGLYVSHLPLDGNKQIGNAAGIADLLNLRNREKFGKIGEEYIGQKGILKNSTRARKIYDKLQKNLNIAEERTQILDFGKNNVENIGIVTGSGSDWLDEAVEKKIDLFITGEGKQKIYHQAKESGINVFLGGHYATETFGVKSLKKLVSGWGLETVYIDHPTGL